MRYAEKILILPLLCQALFAIGLSFESFEKAIFDTGPFSPPSAEGAVDLKPPLLFSAFKVWSVSQNIFSGDIGIILPTNNLFLPSIAKNSVPDIFNTGFPPVGKRADKTKIDEPDEGSPENQIIQEPDILPLSPFKNSPLSDHNETLIMEIRPEKGSSKYVIKEQVNSSQERATLITKTSFLDKKLEEGFGQDTEDSFRMLLLKPNDPAFMIDDTDSEESQPAVSAIEGRVLHSVLQRLVAAGAQYVVIYDSNGAIQVKVRYANGDIQMLSQEQLLVMFGEWFYDFFETFLDSLYGYATPCYTYQSQSGAVVIPHKRKNQSQKSDPVKPHKQPEDGQTGSRPSSGKSTPGPDKTSSVQPSVPQARLFASSPHPDHERPGAETVSGFEGNSFSLPAARRERTKPKHRFTVAKATSQLAISPGLQSVGIENLAKTISKEELIKRFKQLDGFPKNKPRRQQIRWLLKQGYAIPLSELLVYKADALKVDETARTLVEQHLERSRSIRRTRIESFSSSHQHEGLARILDTFMNQKELTAEKPKPNDHAALHPLLEKGWRILLADGYRAPFFNSADQRKLLTEAKTGNLDEALTVSTQRALEFLLWDSREALRVSKLITQIIPPEFDRDMEEVMASKPTQSGMIEAALGIGDHVRLADHPTAGGGGVFLGASQRHIKVSYFNDGFSGEYVLIAVSIEFTEIVISNPMQEQTSIPVTLALRTVYQFPLHSTTATSVETQRVVVAITPTLPEPPTESQIQDWTTELHDRQVQLFHENLSKVEARLKDWEDSVSSRTSANIAELKEASRKLKLAQQGFTHNFDYARNWSDISVAELERLARKLLSAMEQYLQKLDIVLEEPSLFQGDSHQPGWQLVRDYRKYVWDMEAVYRNMEKINNRRHDMTQEDLRKIQGLVDQTEAIGCRARNLKTDELPLRRSQLRERKEITQEQEERIEQLRTLYYPLTSGFNIARAWSLLYPPGGVDETDYRRVSQLISEDEQEPRNTSTSSEVSPLEATMPFTFDSLSEEFEDDVFATPVKDNFVPGNGPESGDESSSSPKESQ